MSLIAALPLMHMADAAAATNSMQSFVVPLLSVLDTVAGLLSILGIMYSGYLFMTSSGNPARLQHAKRMLRNSIIGLVIVLGAAAGTAILQHAYTTPAPGSRTAIPTIGEIKPEKTGGGWSTILIDALTGFFTNIITAIASPLLNMLAKFTDGTTLMAGQTQVFNMWLVLLGIGNVLFTLALAMLGFRVMSAEMFGLGEIELRSMLPQIGLVYVLMNVSIFAIDIIISLSNAIISAIYAGFPGTNIWKALIATSVHASGLPLVSLLFFIVFVVLASMLVIYYFERLIILALGAALSPLVVLLWLLPGFRDFANNLIRTYLTVIFVLVVHVVILMLGASFLNGELLGPTGTPNPLADIIVAIAIISTLLATQRFMVQMAVISSGANSVRSMGKQFASGMRYTADKMDDYSGSQLAAMAPELRTKIRYGLAGEPRMKRSIVPAQITTVEDRVLGNLTPYQAGLISAPLVFGIVVYAMLPPHFHLAMYKIGIVVALEVIGAVLSVKKDDQMLAFWVAKRLRYAMRPRIYIYSKNDDFLRSRAVDAPQPKSKQREATEKSSTTLPQIELGEVVRVEQIMADARANLRFKSGKDGRLYALIEEIK